MTGGIYIALGANLPSRFGAPRVTLETALQMLAAENIAVLKRSSWWRSAAVPASDQPDFINAVAELETALQPADLLRLLHQVETICGRIRQQRWEARPLDLDLLDYRGLIEPGNPALESPVLPHPRLQDRRFVLLPLQEIAPDWRHPASGTGLADLIRAAEPMNINKL